VTNECFSDMDLNEKGLTYMVALIDQAVLGTRQRVELYESGVVCLIQESDAPGARNVAEIKLTPAAATQLFEFLLLNQERLFPERDSPMPLT
jgi:hypothetical protein